MKIHKERYLIIAPLLAAICTIVIFHFLPLDFTNYKKELEQAESTLQRSVETKDRFYALTDTAWVAAKSGEFDKAKQYAEEVLTLSEEFRDNWNYGNAIHYGHIALGLVSMSQGNTDEAKKHLLSAGKTPGSPQLATAGPDMSLARLLLKSGERDAVLIYLDECGRFWKSGKFKLSLWQLEIRLGLLPAFR